MQGLQHWGELGEIGPLDVAFVRIKKSVPLIPFSALCMGTPSSLLSKSPVTATDSRYLGAFTMKLGAVSSHIGRLSLMFSCVITVPVRVEMRFTR